jgi:predicted nucleotidyltransferase
MKSVKTIRAARTALDLSPLEWKQYHPFESDNKQSSFSLINRQDSARNIAKRIALEFKEHFGAHRVVLFGSIARGGMHSKSDIDIAVWGIPAKNFYKAVAFAIGYSNEWKVDIVDVEDCRESLKQSILKDGFEL